MTCVRLAISSLLLACLLLPACGQTTDASRQPKLDQAHRKAAPTVANTPTPEYGSFAKLNAKLPQRGESLPPIVGRALDGTVVNNASLEGKTALINLWFYH
jgi:hypothetical protein